jgi:mannose-1-phosphate guanylyltransferase
MFAWRTDSFLSEADRLVPELAAFIRKFPAVDAADYLQAEFPGLPKISVDFAIMEKASSVVCVESDFDWDDVGSWTAVPSHLPNDASSNTIRGSVVAHASGGNIAFSTGRTIALCGVQDLIVVETPDAVLVCPRHRAEEIKKLLPHLPPELLT